MPPASIRHAQCAKRTMQILNRTCCAREQVWLVGAVGGNKKYWMRAQCDDQRDAPASGGLAAAAAGRAEEAAAWERGDWGGLGEEDEERGGEEEQDAVEAGLAEEPGEDPACQASVCKLVDRCSSVVDHLHYFQINTYMGDGSPDC